MNATLCQNFKAIGEELSEITGHVQTNIYIFIYIDDGDSTCLDAALTPLNPTAAHLLELIMQLQFIIRMGIANCYS